MKRNLTLTVNHHIRRGFSLIEVMFSIAVVAIGLLGVLALFPAASHQAQQGLIADTAARLANNSFREFDIRGMRNPNNWVLRNTSPLDSNAPVDTDRIFYLHDRGHSFCIDPMFRAVYPDITTFPYGPFQTAMYTHEESQVPAMHRISLVDRGTFPDRHVLRPQIAAEIFMSHDDLSIVRPDDGQLPPSQNFGSLNSRRQFDGRYSWMATLVPELDPIPLELPPELDEYTGLPELEPQTNDHYLLSIVVYYQRDLGFDPTSTDPEEHAEHVVQTTITGGGIGGGDVLLTADTEAELEVTENQWIMLSGMLYAVNPAWGTPNTGYRQFPYFRWYQVVTRGKIVPRSDGRYDRFLTLQGPDWPVANPNRSAYVYASEPSTRAIIPKNVVNVVERTVRLDDANLWRQSR